MTTIKGWVAEDEDGNLCLYDEVKPEKGTHIWKTEGEFVEINIPIWKNLFPEVKWEDEEPTEVELTIKKI